MVSSKDGETSTSRGQVRRRSSNEVVFLLALLLTSASCVTSPNDVDRAVKLLFKQAVVFSDSDDDPGSTTTTSLVPDAPAFTFNTDTRGYAGIGLPLRGRDLTGFKAINVEYRITGGTARHIQFESVDGVRQRLSLAPYAKPLNSDWMIAHVPLEAFYLFDDAEWAAVSTLAFIVHGRGQMDFRKFSLTAIDAEPPPDDDTSPEPPVAKESTVVTKPSPTTRGPFTKGFALWVDRSNETTADTIRDFNAHAVVPIRYIFVRTGTIGERVSLDVAAANYYAQRLPQCQIFAAFTGHASQLPATPDNHEQLARTLALFNSNPRIAGVYIDIDSVDDNASALLDIIDAALSKPLAIAVRRWSGNRIRAGQLAVLIGFNLASSPHEFRRIAQRMYNAFATAARSSNQYYMLGIPCAATLREYEYVLGRGNDAKEVHTMNHYTTEALDIVQQVKDNSHFVGPAIWGEFAEPVGEPGGLRYFPYTISTENWQQLIKFRF